MATFPRELDEIICNDHISMDAAIKSAYLLGRRSLLKPIQDRIDSAVLAPEARRELIQVRDKILARSQDRSRVKVSA